MKIVFIGDSNVGKSALIYRFVHNESLVDAKATVGIAFKRTQIIDPETGEEYKIQLWDTAGQEKFQSVTTHHYRAADGAVLVFDTTSHDSLQSTDRWLQELREHTDENVVVALVANKMDLGETAYLAEAESFAKSQGLLNFHSSSMWDKVRSPEGSAVGIEGILLEICRSITKRGAAASRLDVGRSGVQLLDDAEPDQETTKSCASCLQ